jgi:chromosome condensin MukBEF MukE localization factor
LNDFNQVLEDFYNENGKEEINYKKHFFYFNNVVNKQIPNIV